MASSRSGFRLNLILLDMLLPEMDGWRFLRQLFSDKAIADVPVVIVTALGIASHEWALALGAVGLIRKPIDTHELLKEIGARCLSTP